MTPPPHAMRCFVGALAVLSLHAVPCAAQSSSEQRRQAQITDLLAAQRHWWEAITAADTAYLVNHSSPRLAATLSSGKVYDRTALVRSAASVSHQIHTRWSNETVHARSATILVARADATEADGPRSSSYRYMTVFERTAGARDGSGAWRVIAAQSTRAPVFTSRVPMSAAGDVASYAGEYRTPRGLALRVSVEDSVLKLVEPSGRELRYWPIGPGFFESDYVAPDGAITRLAFSRDNLGNVTTLLVESPGVVSTFPRMK